MPTPGEHFDAGDLDQAIEASLQQVRAKPNDFGARWLMCELMCFRGEFDRIEKHLETLTQQKPEHATQLALFRQLVRAELARTAVFQSGATPELLEAPVEAVRRGLQMLVNSRSGVSNTEFLEETGDWSLSGEWNGQSFESIRDLDDLLSHVAEVHTSTGKYFWIPFDCIESLEFHAPQRPRDLLWRPAHMVIRGGPDGEVFWPTLYPGTSQLEDAALRLGRATDWVEDSSGVTRGQGLKMFAFGEEEISIMDLQTLRFSTPRSLNSVNAEPASADSANAVSSAGSDSA
ncbi:MAG TPA: type VI secretion system accessory protein TagJ [Planctomicrobium sp.]|nr:type VI secretion system accessory protein TagJ [Planctomicrobium sp.]